MVVSMHLRAIKTSGWVFLDAPCRRPARGLWMLFACFSWNVKRLCAICGWETLRFGRVQNTLAPSVQKSRCECTRNSVRVEAQVGATFLRGWGGLKKTLGEGAVEGGDFASQKGADGEGVSMCFFLVMTGKKCYSLHVIWVRCAQRAERSVLGNTMEKEEAERKWPGH